MSSVPQPAPDELSSIRFARMELSDLEEVQAVENLAYPYPWTMGNFIDSLHSGYDAWVARDAGGALVGYFVLMFAVDEAHLLNITVRRELHGRGIGRLLLDRVAAIANDRIMVSILLEVRPSNERALHVYRRYGFTEIGRRKGYYPAAGKTREDAIVMKMEL